MKRQLALLGALLLAALLVMAQPGSSQSVGDATPTADIEAAPEMAFVPSDCGILAEPVAIDPLIPHAIGAWPIWIALPNGSSEMKGILVVPNEHYFTHPQLEGWWVTKAAWFIAKSYPGEVRIRGVNIDDDSPIYFEIGDHELREVATLNPDQPGGYVTELDALAFFPSHMWVSKAGCYRLEAEWDGGLWQQIIAVGSVE
jgi:hypothetical protein